MIPRVCAMRDWVEWEEWAASTLSQKVAWEREGTGRMDIGCRCSLGGFVPLFWGLDMYAPEPFCAVKMTPRSMLSSAESVVTDSGEEILRSVSAGRFGQPNTPTLTSPSTISATQTAYCPPLKNPFVPSIGSIVHILPFAPPSPFPASNASSIAV